MCTLKFHRVTFKVNFERMARRLETFPVLTLLILLSNKISCVVQISFFGGVILNEAVNWVLKHILREPRPCAGDCEHTIDILYPHYILT